MHWHPPSVAANALAAPVYHLRLIAASSWRSVTSCSQLRTAAVEAKIPSSALATSESSASSSGLLFCQMDPAPAMMVIGRPSTAPR